MKKNLKFYFFYKSMLNLSIFSLYMILCITSVFLFGFALVKANSHLFSLYYVSHNIKCNFAVYSFVLYAFFYFVVSRDINKTDFLFEIRDKCIRYFRLFKKVKNRSVKI